MYPQIHESYSPFVSALHFSTTPSLQSASVRVSPGQSNQIQPNPATPPPPGKEIGKETVKFLTRSERGRARCPHRAGSGSRLQRGAVGNPSRACHSRPTSTSPFSLLPPVKSLPREELDLLHALHQKC